MAATAASANSKASTNAGIGHEDSEASEPWSQDGEEKTWNITINHVCLETLQLRRGFSEEAVTTYPTFVRSGVGNHPFVLSYMVANQDPACTFNAPCVQQKVAGGHDHDRCFP